MFINQTDYKIMTLLVDFIKKKKTVNKLLVEMNEYLESFPVLYRGPWNNVVLIVDESILQRSI